ncbi:hypothetical protein SAMN02745157_2537 [Kaistia soli DSM 19436]|uniref:Homeodomain-like domain-containing protein n=1 Tax=Kaistia soli DSM 19436 TaxID=1122133 RepID=A0A1M5D1Z9_9HYPH|nr:hypothetical protein SAMN02745157_2537 [Kaistia soli DSM 19436]
MRDLFGEDPRRPSRRLTYDDAVKIQSMLLDGWTQNRIAAQFDVNSARVSEIKSGDKHSGSRAEAVKRR